MQPPSPALQPATRAMRENRALSEASCSACSKCLRAPTCLRARGAESEAPQHLWQQVVPGAELGPLVQPVLEPFGFPSPPQSIKPLIEDQLILEAR